MATGQLLHSGQDCEAGALCLEEQRELQSNLGQLSSNFLSSGSQGFVYVLRNNGVPDGSSWAQNSLSAKLPREAKGVVKGSRYH